jgi:hypothetical protein
MTDPKDFLTRWSRRKLESAEEADGATSVPQASSESAGAGAAPAPADATPASDFNPATLPSIESIGAGSDIRAFLQRGVPAGITRAALRRAWAADPAIRDFIGLSENAWDFNAPDSMPGFGPLELEDVRRLAAQLLGEPGAAESPDPEPSPLAQSASVQGKSEVTAASDMRDPEPPVATPNQVHDLEELEVDRGKTPSEGKREVDVAVQYKEEKAEYDRASLAQRHGGALPKQT